MDSIRQVMLCLQTADQGVPDRQVDSVRQVMLCLQTADQGVPDTQVDRWTVSDR